ncbi:hypothetical protein ACJ73_07249 [Blastomyces percursus]|uniref:F-box domain-containing protein n=1 Tax=Blastomyces percursus TaxID=1658174 RepID=A0A1J9R1D8_9EURO|nr:hypothetical protein ACJ73_07249 [Blastomyces percursus]
MAMPNTLSNDIWYCIATQYLDYRAYTCLSMIDRRLYALLEVNKVACKVVQRDHAYTNEAALAKKGAISWRGAIRYIFLTREAIARALPSSACSIENVNEFRYYQGVLCYKQQGLVRIMNALATAAGCAVVDVQKAIAQTLPNIARANTDFQLLHYSNGLLSVLCRLENMSMSTSSLFVRNGDKFIMYGSHSYQRWNENWEWEIQAVDLETGKAMFEPPIKLSNCDGSEIGKEVCFEMRDSHLYAIFNTPLNGTRGEINWTSFYHCIRISAADSKKTMWRRMWRRQDEEGPINDWWTHLSLDINEATGNLVLTECRREYLGGRSENYRTAYHQIIDGPEPNDCWTVENLEPAFNGLPHYIPDQLPLNNPLVRLLGSEDRPSYAPPRTRLASQYHREYIEEEAESPERQDFNWSCTMFRKYSPRASAFIDVGRKSAADRLCLRVVARRQKCPIDREGEKGLLYSKAIDEAMFESRGIKYWPTKDGCPENWNSLGSCSSCSLHADGDEHLVAVFNGSKLVIVTFAPDFGHLLP